MLMPTRIVPAGNYGQIDQVASGTGGIASADGSFHAQVAGSTLGYGSGPFSRFDGYRGWPGEWLAELDIYLDTGWSAGSGFDLSVAATGTNNAHRRDFIFHVTKDTSKRDSSVAPITPTSRPEKTWKGSITLSCRPAVGIPSNTASMTRWRVGRRSDSARLRRQRALYGDTVQPERHDSGHRRWQSLHVVHPCDRHGTGH